MISPKISLLAKLSDMGMALGGKSFDERPPRFGPGLTFWTRAFGAWADFDGNKNAATADRDLGGFVSGMDAGVPASRARGAPVR